MFGGGVYFFTHWGVAVILLKTVFQRSKWPPNSINIDLSLTWPASSMPAFITYCDNMTGAPDGTVLQNIYSADIVSWLTKSAEQIMNLNKCW